MVNGFAPVLGSAMELFVLTFLVCFGTVIGVGLALDRWETGRRYERPVRWLDQ